MSQAKAAKKVVTYAEFSTWPDNERWEIIDGEAYAMTPGPSTLHQMVFRGLFRQLDAFFRTGPCQVFSDPYEFRLARPGQREEDIIDVVRPDLAVVCDPARYDEKGGIGAPDFVIEILSRSSASRDQVAKRRLYERHGVKEYWVVDPEERLVFVSRLTSAGTFSGADIFSTDGLRLAVATFPGLAIDFDEALPRSSRPEGSGPSPASR